MKQGDFRFLQRLVSANKEVIREDCARRKLGRKAYFARVGKAEKKANEILRGGSRN